MNGNCKLISMNMVSISSGKFHLEALYAIHILESLIPGNPLMTMEVPGW
jgi:hypothetical protein